MSTLPTERLRIIAASLVNTENLRLLAAILVSLGMEVYGPRNTFFAYITAISLGLIGALFVAPKSHRREFLAATVLVWFVFAIWTSTR